MINFGFDNIETLKSKEKSICFHLNDDLYQFNQDLVENYISRDESFIYPLLIWNNDLFLNVKKFEVPQNVKTQIEREKCKLVIFYITEPWFMYEYCYKWMSTFSKENNLTKENFLFVSSNLRAPEVKDNYVKDCVIEDNFTIIGFNYFFHRLWFFPHRFHEEYSNEIYGDNLKKILEDKKLTKKEKHFLCFNRKPHDHRVAIFAEIMTNPVLKEKTILTLGNQSLINGQNFKEAIRRFVDNNYKYGNDRLYNFIDTYDSQNDYLYDTPSHFDEQSIHINVDVQNKTFCNVVTETLTGENLLFFSEKIIKPIFALQPFIIFGNRGSLKKLKEFGFKTFDRWWDESYDDLYYQNRFEKIIELMLEISKWDDDKINITLIEMEDTLIHNYKMLIEDNSTKEFYNNFLKLI